MHLPQTGYLHTLCLCLGQADFSNQFVHQLQNLFVSEVREWVSGARQNFVAIGSSFEAKFVVLASNEVVIEHIGLSFDIQVVKHRVGGNLLLNGGWVSACVNVVFEAEVGYFLVGFETILDGRGEVGQELLGHDDNLEVVVDCGAGGFSEDLASEFDDRVGCLVIEAVNNSCGSGKLVLIEHAVESLLHDLFISEREAEGNQGQETEESFAHGELQSTSIVHTNIPCYLQNYPSKHQPPHTSTACTHNTWPVWQSPVGQDLSTSRVGKMDENLSGSWHWGQLTQELRLCWNWGEIAGLVYL